MAKNIKKKVIKEKNVSYLAKDFDSFRAELTAYAKQHYGSKIIDFSESSVSGMFLDVAAYVGDALSFYLDHQFNELSLETAVETKNIETLVRQAGVKIQGASPAFVLAKLSLVVPAKTIKGKRTVNEDFLPKVLEGTVLTSHSGIDFYLLETIDFAEKDNTGELIGNVIVNNVNGTSIQDFIIEREVPLSSAKFIVETFNISNNIVPFRTITLNNTNVHEVIFVKDSAGDEYHEVDSLTQDTVYKRIENSRNDKELVPSRLQIIPASKRYVSISSSLNAKTTLQFGSGDEDTFDEDVIPDPSEHAVTLYGDRKTFSRIAIDPNSFLSTNTLGVSPRNTTLTVKYSYGGGVNHNISAGELVIVKTLKTFFNSSTPSSVVAGIRRSASIVNEFPAAGGENEPTIEELRVVGLLSKTNQKRVVTREDLLARIYNMPTNFGRVFRASVRDNPNNPFATQLHVISRNKLGLLVISPDSLKENLSIFLSKFRLISDAIDIVDAQIINLGIKYSVTLDAGINKTSAMQKINSTLKSYFKIENFQIDQPIILGEIENLILNSFGVMSLISLKIINKSNVESNRIYSKQVFSTTRNLDRGMIFPPRGGIFEIRYPGDDIEGSVI